jgi:hypothetical protein
MKKFIIGGIAAVVLALGFTAGNASADWVTRTRYRWDPECGRYVAVAERVWVPDVVVPAPVYPAPGVYVDFYRYRPWYYSGYYHLHHGHHHHDHDHDHHHHH